MRLKKNIKELQLTLPEGDNALEKYLQVAKIDPKNKQVILGLEKIIENYKMLAQGAKVKGKRLKEQNYLLKIQQVENTLNLVGLNKFFTKQGQGSAVKANYVTQGNGTVIDTDTGLQWIRCSLGQTWQNNTCVGEAKKYKWQQVASRGLTTYAGYSDWRVSTIKELNTLVYCSNGKTIHYKQQGYHNQKTEGGNGCEGDSGDPHQKPTIVKTIFPNTVSGGYWSSSPNMDDSKVAWGVYFSAGHDYYDYRYYSRYVRLVRAVQ